MKNEIMLPRQWEDWEIIESIGSGAYGQVYKVRRRIGMVETISAVKVVSIPYDFQEAEYVARDLPDMEALRDYYAKLVDDYVREIRAMVSLEGLTNIVSIEDYAIEPQVTGVGSCIFIRMEYLQSFPEYAAAHKMTEPEVIRLGIDMCTALGYCEDIKLVHRDIKPDNIFVSKHGDFKLGDFGIAGRIDNLTKTTSLKGTSSYMAPEVFTEQTYSAKTDLYALGLVLYRLLNNNKDAFINPMKQLVYARDREEALQRRLRGDTLPRPAACSDEMYAVLLKACAFRPEDRYSSAKDMRNSLVILAKNQTAESSEDHTERNKEAVGEEDNTESGSFWRIPVTLDSGEERSGTGQDSVHQGKLPGYTRRKPGNDGRKRAFAATAAILTIAACILVISYVWWWNRQREVRSGTNQTESSLTEHTILSSSSPADIAFYSKLFDVSQMAETKIEGYRRILWTLSPEEAQALLMKDGAPCKISNSSGSTVLSSVTTNSSEGIELSEEYYYSEKKELREVDASVRLLVSNETETEQQKNSIDLFTKTVELLKLFYGEPLRKELASGKHAAGWTDTDGDLIVVYADGSDLTGTHIIAYHPE